MATPCHEHDRRKHPPRRLPAPQGALETVGPLRLGAGLGHRARGLQRGRDRVGLPAARPRPIARLPLERGRHRRRLRSSPDRLPRDGALERARSDPEGTDVRPHRRGRQPRRGREGVLLLSGQHADALVHAVSLQVSAAGVSVRAAGRREPPSRPRGARVRAARHRDLRGRPLLRRVRRVRQGRSRRSADADSGAQPWTGAGAPARAADGVVPQHLVVVRRDGSSIARRHGRCPAGLLAPAGELVTIRRAVAVCRRRAGAVLHRERDQRRAALRHRRARPAISRTASTIGSSTAGSRP